jgi:Flp pilus assembly protein TadG
MLRLSTQKRRRPLHGRECRGVATVELALCLPMLAVLVFGSMQACDLIYLKHAITSAAYEGTLELVRPDSSAARVKTRVEQVLDLRDVSDYTVEIRPTGINLSEAPAGTSITIAVSANVSSNLMLSGFFATAENVQTELRCPR